MQMIGVAASAAVEPPTFSGPHILLTAAVTGLLALAAATLLKVRSVDLGALTLVAFAATWLLRTAANMGQLNDDGLPGFSANDCLAPIVTWVALAVYADLRGTPPTAAWRRARAATTLLAFAVNVVTI